MRQARVGDTGIGICPNHNTPQQYTTVFVTGAKNVFVNGLECALVDVTIGISSCGHPTIAITGSTKTFRENHACHRLGDIGINYGPYSVVTASENVDTD
jgi:hypothetical protein